MYPLHPPAGKRTSMTFSADMLPVTLGARAAHVAAGGGMLQLVRRRVSLLAKMQPKCMARAWMCGAQRVSVTCTSWAGFGGVQPHRLATLARPCRRAGGPRPEKLVSARFCYAFPSVQKG